MAYNDEGFWIPDSEPELNKIMGVKGVVMDDIIPNKPFDYTDPTRSSAAVVAEDVIPPKPVTSSRYDNNLMTISGVGNRMMIQQNPRDTNPVDEFGSPVSQETMQRIQNNLNDAPINEEDQSFFGLRPPSEQDLDTSAQLADYQQFLKKTVFKDADMNDPNVQVRFRDASLHGLKKIQEQRVNKSSVSETDVAAIGDQMMAGKMPPVISNAYRKIAPELQAYLAKKGFDQTQAEADWIATKKHLTSLNSTQQLRLGQAVAFTKESLPIVEDLAAQWKAGGFAPLSYAALKSAEQGLLGTKAQSIATRLNAQINDLTSELGTVYKGGNSSTDESLKLAAANLKGQWEESVLMDNIKQIRTNLTLRENSMRTSGIAGLSNNSLYKRLDKSTSTEAQQNNTGGPKIGSVAKGYRFKGGNPADKNSWEKI
jgi:hypothetical protein